METQGGFLLLLLVGPMLLMLCSYQWNTSQDERAEIYRLQEPRKRLVKIQCDGNTEEYAGGKRSVDDMRINELDNLVVDDKHGIIYCYVPKVACTHWKIFFKILNQSDPHLDPNSIRNVHSLRFPLLSDFPRPEIKAKLKHYKKFLFVRDPFVRLISAFRNKFVNKNQYFYQNYARKMLQKYGNQSNPPETVEQASASGVHLSFYNFIQYLVDSQTPRPFEPHWRPMNRLCQPCLIQYDFIGHLENLQQEVGQLMKILMLEDDIKLLPSYPNMTSSDSLWSWFSTVPLEDRRKLYQIYEEDFKLFGYRTPVELLDG
ncbi:carbohydrate sulfotransferase 12-like [Clinocottus analis]|uniref:carbohydrate sulfotransferase 12-like n=1 Tax=Clinocottus analis TaxID=304258 RepID=UPI0035BF555D